jgi:energy-coupling factor transporter transmembrane protein EcfT
MTRKPGLLLSTGLLVVLACAFLPAGLHGAPVPRVSWIVWTSVLTVAFVLQARTLGSAKRALRSLAWLLPPVLLLALPAAFFAGGAGRGVTAAALVTRSLAAAAMGLAAATALGPAGVVAALQALRLPRQLVAVVHAMLVALAGVLRQVRGMLRARAARRAGGTPWSALIVAPAATVRGFGRLVGALFLRSLERAEALERARRARGIDA